MKQEYDANRDSHIRHTINRLACRVSVMSTIMLTAFVPLLQAVDNEDLPQLPSFEVRSSWQEFNLTKPNPVKTATPRLEYNLVGTEIYMTFKIDKHGKPYAIHYNASLSDYRKRMLGEAMRLNLKDWKFTPAVNSLGDAVEVRVALPVKVIGSNSSGADKVAMLTMSNPVLLAVLDR